MSDGSNIREEVGAIVYVSILFIVMRTASIFR